MNRAVLASIFLVTACAKVADQPSCAVAPSGFYSWRIEPAVIGNVIKVSNKTIAWNGADLEGIKGRPAFTVLDRYLAASARLEPMPFAALTFEKEVACSRVTAVRAMMEKHLSCRTNVGKCLQGAPPS